MTAIIELVKPVLIGWLTSAGARELLVEVLRKLAAKTDNEIDDTIVEGVARALSVEVTEAE